MQSRFLSLLIFLPLLLFRQPLSAASRMPLATDKGLVVTTNARASAVGADILRKGGSAADATVAVAFALAVTWPTAGNIGGGGFALLGKGDGSHEFIDYRETAPAAAGPDFYRKADGSVDGDASKNGFRAVGVPGTVAGLAYLHQKYGKLPWKTLLEPARRLAADGFPVDDHLIRSLRKNEKHLSRFPESKRLYLNDGRFWQRGDIFRQKDLAKTIALLQKKGARVFYEGELADRLVASIQKGGGVISKEDLKTYKVESRAPIEKDWRNFRIVSAPPPSSGGTVLLQILGMLENDDLKKLGFGSAAYTHLLVEAMKRAFADRSQWFADPAFHSNPIEKLLAKDYLAERRRAIDLEKAAKEVSFGNLPDEKPETTHFSIRDRHGMVVSNTYTLNGNYGAGVIAGDTGILLNNEMDDFTVAPGEINSFGLKQGLRNAIAPRKRPLSSMTPTLVYEKDRLVLALGSPGGPTIINAVGQVLINRLVFGMTIQEAVDAPRVHHQWYPDSIRWEPLGLNTDTRAILEKKGHRFDESPANIGDVQALAWDAAEAWTGAADPRLGGQVALE